jgi:hypothetical protein
MPNFFYLKLDRTGPQGISVSINSGQAFTNNVLNNLTIGTSDGDTTGYMMKIWGSVDNAHNANIKTTEGASAWIAYNTTQQVKVSATDGLKTINIKVRDRVLNESSQQSASITLDTTLATVSITGPDLNEIGENAGANTSSFSFTVDSPFVEYKVCVVPAEGSIHSAGTVIGNAAGSVNVGGTGTFPASTPINVQIKGTDLYNASNVDGQKIIKVFVRESSGNWSV